MSHSIHMKEPQNGDELMDFWAPFLLLHLGGPDTITAYSLEDNNLWLRHLLGLIVQGSIALYVTSRSWNGSLVSILSVLMYVPALIKYGERTWALRYASKEHFRDSMLREPDPGGNYSMLGEPDPGPNNATVKEECKSMQEEGFWPILDSGYEVENPQQTDAAEAVVDQGNKSNVVSDEDGDAQILIKAHYFFRIFKRLIAFVILSHEEWEESKSIFQRLSYDQAFHMIDIELKFMFDELYTKASVVYSKKGCILRSVSFSFTIFVFVLFLMKVDKLGHRLLAGPGPGPDPDVLITYMLLVLGIFLEICALVILIYSDSAFLWLRKRGPLIKNWAFRNLQKRSKKKKKKEKWSNSIAQHSLLSVWFKDCEPTWRRCATGKLLISMNKTLKRYRYTRHEKVDDPLMEFIFTELRRRAETVTDLDGARNTCRRSVRFVIGDIDDSLIRWSVKEAEFDQSLLVWHIVTELCYYYPDSSDPEPKKKKAFRRMWKHLSDYMMCLLRSDPEPEKRKEEDSSDDPQPFRRRMCKHLSDYMVYLLLVCPNMLPDGIGEVRLHDTQEEVKQVMRSLTEEWNLANACELILAKKTEIPPVGVKGPAISNSKSVLFDACRLARPLNRMSNEGNKWEIIGGVWVEILSYAAVQSRGPENAGRLGQGGELLTHVWLLMAHLGLTEQFQMPADPIMLISG